MDAESCWLLFEETGAPEYYLLYQTLARKEQEGAE